MKEYLNETIDDLIIKVDKVAFVHKDHTLEHALLVLTQSGYTAIPVLDYSNKIFGLVSTPLIMKAILEVEKINFSLLETIKVEQIITDKFSYCYEKASFIKVFPLLIDAPFLCVVNEKKEFVGILTRREVLKKFKTSTI